MRTATIVRGSRARMAIPLLVLMLAALPITSAYLGPNIDMTDYAVDRTCYCHGAEVSPNVTIVIDMPDQISYNPGNETVRVHVGILGDPQNLTGFALFLNGTKSQNNLRWVYDFGTGDQVLEPRDYIKINTTTLWHIAPISDRWFNFSFVPGNVDQDIIISVTGMRANANNNETGDLWAVGLKTIEVREQRLATLNVTISNSEPISISEVLVDLYVDGEYIGNHTIPHIGQEGEENVSIDWDITYVEDGKHTLRAVIDPYERLTVLDRDDLDITTEIWLGEHPEEPDYSLYYGIGSVAVGVAIIMMVFWFWRRRQYRF